MSNSEAFGEQPNDLARLIDEVAQTMGGASQGYDTAAGPLDQTPESSYPTNQSGITIEMTRYADGQARPASIEFSMFASEGDLSLSPEMEALRLAWDEYRKRAELAQSKRGKLDWRNFTDMFAYADADDRLAEDQAKERILRRVRSGLLPQRNRADGREGTVRVSGTDTEVVYEALLLGLKLWAKNESGGDERRYEQILAERMAALTYNDLSDSGEDGGQ